MALGLVEAARGSHVPTGMLAHEIELRDAQRAWPGFLRLGCQSFFGRSFVFCQACLFGDFPDHGCHLRSRVVGRNVRRDLALGFYRQI